MIIQGSTVRFATPRGRSTGTTHTVLDAGSDTVQTRCGIWGFLPESPYAGTHDKRATHTPEQEVTCSRCNR